jgi:hypothetical protein
VEGTGYGWSEMVTDDHVQHPRASSVRHPGADVMLGGFKPPARIGRANLDGSGVNQTFIGGLTSVLGIAVTPQWLWSHR